MTIGLLEFPTGEDADNLDLWLTFLEQSSVNLNQMIETKTLDEVLPHLENMFQASKHLPSNAKLNCQLSNGSNFIHFTSDLLERLEDGNFYASELALQLVKRIYDIHTNFTDSCALYCEKLCEYDLFLRITKRYVLLARDCWDMVDANPEFTLVLCSVVSVLYNIVCHPQCAVYFQCEIIQNALILFMKSSSEDVICVSTLALAYLVNENNRSLLVNASESMEMILRYIQLAKQSDNKLSKRYNGFSCSELLAALSALTVDDRVNESLIQHGGVELLKELCEDASTEELIFTTQILWNLSFDFANSELLESKFEISKFFEELRDQLHKLDPPPKKPLKNIAGAMWLLKKHRNGGCNSGKHPASSYPPTSDDALDGKSGESSNAAVPDKEKYDLFISYCWSDKAKVLPIRERLAAESINCWIDVEQMQGSTIEAMSSGIEDSRVVVICMSEAYKLSPNCRMEAEFALAQHKPFIALIMQERYKPNGWLGFLLGAKLYYDFSGRRDFDAIFHQFLQNCQRHLSAAPEERSHASTTNTKLTPMSPTKLPTAPFSCYSHTKRHGASVDKVIFEWTASQLATWLGSEAVQLGHLQPAFDQINGHLFTELLFLRLECPAVFYSTLSEQFGMSHMDKLKFCHAINEFLLL